MKELTEQEIREVQMGILQEFHNFCTAHNIKYSLCGGTLLGAVRHKGFIPWDDDIDVMLPRREYKKLLALYKSDKFTLYTYDTCPKYMQSFAKLCDNRTLLTEHIVYEPDYGVDIDIFPLDFFPDNEEESRRWADHLKRWKNIRSLKNMTVNSHRSFIKNAIVIISRILLSPLPMKYVVRKIDIDAQKYANKIDGYLGNMTNGKGYKERNPMAKKLVDIEFEGHFYKAIDNYDIYLSNLYGNYMSPPPTAKERETTHTNTAWWIE